METYIEELRRRVERAWGREVTTPSSINDLLRDIKAKTGNSLSQSTIKRVWGLVTWRPQSSGTTLEILATYAGYAGWKAFCEAMDGRNSSDFIGKALHSSEIAPGTMVCLSWQPDRTCRLRYDGEQMFTVMEHTNSKLQVGARLRMTTIADGCPLIVDELWLPGEDTPQAYIAGKTNGVKIESVN